MDLLARDLHVMFDAAGRTLTVWDASHRQLFQAEARNRTTNDGQRGHWGSLPSGLYLLGAPVVKNTVPFGPFYVPITDFGPNRALADHGRSGVGIHGGGSGAPDPFAAHQVWVPTHGCVRMANIDLRQLVRLILAAQQGSGKCYFTCTAILPGAGKAEADDYLLGTEIEEDE
jgi:hypothetical protein